MTVNVLEKIRSISSTRPPSWHRSMLDARWCVWKSVRNYNNKDAPDKKMPSAICVFYLLSSRICCGCCYYRGLTRMRPQCTTRQSVGDRASEAIKLISTVGYSRGAWTVYPEVISSLVTAENERNTKECRNENMYRASPVPRDRKWIIYFLRRSAEHSIGILTLQIKYLTRMIFIRWPGGKKISLAASGEAHAVLNFGQQ